MMTYIPGGMILVFIALFLFYYFDQKSKIRRREKREALQEKRQEQLDALLKK